MSSLADNGQTTHFFYNVDGQRTHKQLQQGETVYVNPFYVVRSGQISTKQVFAGPTRVASKIARSTGNGTPVEQFLYFYQPDHLGSSSYVTDENAQIFQHDEYFPSGEIWVEENSNTERTPYLFNGKELDETGLYYYGARYYDPRVGVWQNPDPILTAYLAGRPSGGVYNPGNLNLYSYTWNNPVVMKDPDGNIIWFIVAAAVIITALTTPSIANAPAPGDKTYPSPGAGALAMLGVVSAVMVTAVATMDQMMFHPGHS